MISSVTVSQIDRECAVCRRLILAGQEYLLTTKTTYDKDGREVRTNSRRHKSCFAKYAKELSQ